MIEKLLFSINRLNNVFWGKIVRSVHSGTNSLSVLRVIVGLFLLFFYSPGYGWIGNMPQIFYKPPFLSFAILFNSFPAATFFQAIDVILLLCVVFIIFGIKAKISSIVYCVLSVIALSFQYSFGKIDHNILLYVMIFCLSFSGWGSQLAIFPDKEVSTNTQNGSLSALAFILCYAFFTAGFNKSLNWINTDFTKSGTALWIYFNYYITSRTYLLADYIKGMPFLTFKIMDYLGVAFEVSPILFLFYSRKAWGTWLVVAALFHLSTLLFLNIAFLTHTVIYLVFVDFSGVYKWINNLLAKKAYKFTAVAIIAGCFIIRICDIFNFHTSKIIFFADVCTKEILFLSLAIWIIVFILLYKNTFRAKNIPA